MLFALLTATPRAAIAGVALPTEKLFTSANGMLKLRAVPAGVTAATGTLTTTDAAGKEI